MAVQDANVPRLAASPWQQVARVATAVGIGLSAISAAKLVFTAFAIGISPALQMAFDFYAGTLHAILDPLAGYLIAIPFEPLRATLRSFFSLPYWRDAVTLYVLLGA